MSDQFQVFGVRSYMEEDSVDEFYVLVISLKPLETEINLKFFTY